MTTPISKGAPRTGKVLQGAKPLWGVGAEGYVVYRGLDDLNSVTVMHYFADREGAERFVNDPAIRAAIGYWNAPKMPDVHVCEEVARLF